MLEMTVANFISYYDHVRKHHGTAKDGEERELRAVSDKYFLSTRGICLLTLLEVLSAVGCTA